MLIKIFVFLISLTLPVLLPLNFVGRNGTVGGNQGLDKLSWSNIGSSQVDIYWIHLIIALLGIAFICHTIHKELASAVRIRQLYLSNPGHDGRPSASTVLVTDVPRASRTVEALRWAFSTLPDGVCHVWINRDVSSLLEKVKEQTDLIAKLEAAQTALLKKVVGIRTRSRGHEGQAGESTIEGSHDLWDQYVAEKALLLKRLPAKRVWMPSIPWIGERVNAIDYFSAELLRVRKEIRAILDFLMREEVSEKEGRKSATKQMGESIQKCTPLDSAFVQFNNRQAAHIACQVVSHSTPLALLTGSVDARPDSIMWENLRYQWWHRCCWTGVVSLLMGILAIVWAVPVGFTGFFSQLTVLATALPWLSWINQLPDWLVGFLQGFVPQISLALLSLLLRIVARKLVAYQRPPTTTAFELSMQRYYFTILFVQNVLTVSLSSSITAIIQDVLGGLDSVPALVARNLPKASNYFLSYLIIRGFSVSAQILLQLGGLFNWFCLAPVLDRTPRDRWTRQKNLHRQFWGDLAPLYTTLACIGRSIRLTWIIAHEGFRNHVFSHVPPDTRFQHTCIWAFLANLSATFLQHWRFSV